MPFSIDDVIFGYDLPFHVRPVWILIGIWMLFWGLAGFVMMGVDKGRAEGGFWRISEMDLFFVAYMGGFLGILLGIEAFHHKTSDIVFMGLTYSAVGLWVWILSQALTMYGSPLTG